jgi:Flp pilus assembly protein TadD
MSVLAAIVLAACATQRPIDTVRESGDRAYNRGDYSLAAAEFEEIAQRYPGDWEAQYMLGLTMLELDRLADARRALEIAHDRRPNDPKVIDALAEVMYRQNDAAELFAFLREQAETVQSPQAYLRLARYSLEMNDPDSAQVAIRTAIELDDGLSVEPYLAAAELAERLGDLELAVRRLRQAYGIDPRDERVRERLRDLGEIPGPTLALPPGR